MTASPLELAFLEAIHPQEARYLDQLVDQQPGSLWHAEGSRIYDVATLTPEGYLLGLHHLQKTMTVVNNGITRPEPVHHLVLLAESAESSRGPKVYESVGQLADSVPLTTESDELVKELVAANLKFALGRMAMLGEEEMIRRFGGLDAYVEYVSDFSEQLTFFTSLMEALSTGKLLLHDGRIDLQMQN